MSDEPKTLLMGQPGPKEQPTRAGEPRTQLTHEAPTVAVADPDPSANPTATGRPGATSDPTTLIGRPPNTGWPRQQPNDSRRRQTQQPNAGQQGQTQQPNAGQQWQTQQPDAGQQGQAQQPNASQQWPTQESSQRSPVQPSNPHPGAQAPRPQGDSAAATQMQAGAPRAPVRRPPARPREPATRLHVGLPSVIVKPEEPPPAPKTLTETPEGLSNVAAHEGLSDVAARERLSNVAARPATETQLEALSKFAPHLDTADLTPAPTGNTDPVGRKSSSMVSVVAIAAACLITIGFGITIAKRFVARRAVSHAANASAPQATQMADQTEAAQATGFATNPTAERTPRGAVPPTPGAAAEAVQATAVVEPAREPLRGEAPGTIPATATGVEAAAPTPARTDTSATAVGPAAATPTGGSPVPTTAAAPPATGKVATLELQAVQALMANDATKALATYTALAAARPDVAAFSTMARHLKRAQKACTREPCDK